SFRARDVADGGRPDVTAAPREPCVIIARRGRPFEPLNSIKQHDLAGEGLAAPKQVLTRFRGIEIDAQQRRNARYSECERVLDELDRKLAAFVFAVRRVRDQVGHAGRRRGGREKIRVSADCVKAPDAQHRHQLADAAARVPNSADGRCPSRGKQREEWPRDGCVVLVGRTGVSARALTHHTAPVSREESAVPAFARGRRRWGFSQTISFAITSHTRPTPARWTILASSSSLISSDTAGTGGDFILGSTSGRTPSSTRCSSFGPSFAATWR